MIRKRWVEPEKIDESIAKKLKEYSPLIQQLLYSRGIRTKQEADEFMNLSGEIDGEKEHHDKFVPGLILLPFPGPDLVFGQLPDLI